MAVATAVAKSVTAKSRCICTGRGPRGHVGGSVDRLELVRRPDLGDSGSAADLFTSDGIWEWPYGSRTIRGRVQLRAYFGSRPADRKSRRLCTNVLEDVESPTEARATSYLVTYRADGWRDMVPPVSADQRRALRRYVHAGRRRLAARASPTRHSVRRGNPASVTLRRVTADPLPTPVYGDGKTMRQVVELRSRLGRCGREAASKGFGGRLGAEGIAGREYQRGGNWRQRGEGAPLQGCVRPGGHRLLLRLRSR